MNIKFKRLHEKALFPKYAYPGDSGFDVGAIENILILPQQTKIIKTGLIIDIPEGFELQIRPKSGISLKTKLRVNLGTVDSGFRGEICVIIDNISLSIPEHIKAGTKIAQAVFVAVNNNNDFEEVEDGFEFKVTTRGAKKLGSSGE
jgi:dUTP pyrophosphatase